MWIKARDLDGNDIWLNTAQARSIRRVVEDRDGGPVAKTIVCFADGECEIVDTPEQIYAALRSKA